MEKKKVLSLLAAILITALGCFAAVALLLRSQTLEIGAVDLDTVTDGEYIGVCQNKILIAAVKVLHTPDQQLHLHGILAPPCRKGAPLHESKESLQIKSQ